ncbi:hypothetical protein L198_06126 [Cryptococcus wingfieldii CBS 7118]|uniref:Uncharacterized protein n=1 Tax=Cryptococcus wingfieldii CBS 7118 TaxID=1295528 RepID=A0A1E3IQD9_9TREE|nr:hypothetical protein L198_06126 [Cryptococcus wingfieldii CBS 7118]ODN90809.1 hypothetical protein L198_06126 [Cryptococcus wingfieldii CBS 7118]
MNDPRQSTVAQRSLQRHRFQQRQTRRRLIIGEVGQVIGAAAQVVIESQKRYYVKKPLHNSPFGGHQLVSGHRLRHLNDNEPSAVEESSQEEQDEDAEGEEVERSSVLAPDSDDEGEQEDSGDGELIEVAPPPNQKRHSAVATPKKGSPSRASKLSGPEAMQQHGQHLKARLDCLAMSLNDVERASRNELSSLLEEVSSSQLFSPGGRDDIYEMLCSQPLAAPEKEEIDEIFGTLAEKWDITTAEEMEQVLGIKIERKQSAKTFHLSRPKNIDELTDKFPYITKADRPYQSSLYPEQSSLPSTTTRRRRIASSTAYSVPGGSGFVAVDRCGWEVTEKELAREADERIIVSYKSRDEGSRDRTLAGEETGIERKHKMAESVAEKSGLKKSKHHCLGRRK